MDANTLKGHLDLILLATLENEPLYGLRIIQEVQHRPKGFSLSKKAPCILPCTVWRKPAGLTPKPTPPPLEVPRASITNSRNLGQKLCRTNAKNGKLFSRP